MKYINVQGGFSLIELMISLFLSAILLLGLTQIFQGNKAANTLQRSFSRVQETGRIATEIIARDIRMADYWGCLPSADNINNNLDTTDPHYAAAAGNLDFLGDSVDGIENADAADTVDGKNLTIGTDALVLRTSSDACGGLGRATNGTAAALHVEPGCVVPTGPLDEGDIAIISNCETGDMFSITNMQAGGGGASGKKTVVHNTGTCNATTECVDNATKFTNEYGADARILTPVKNTYFVATGTNGNSSLFLQSNSSAAVELVEGVEDMQINYGEDTNSDGAVDVYRENIDLVADKDNILSVKIELEITDDQFANTSEPDGQVRKTFRAISTIRNRTL